MSFIVYNEGQLIIGESRRAVQTVGDLDVQVRILIQEGIGKKFETPCHWEKLTARCSLPVFFPSSGIHCYLELYYLLFSCQDSSAMGKGESPGPSLSVWGPIGFGKG